MKTGTIKHFEYVGKATPFIDNNTGEEVILDKYKVTLADGITWTFNCSGDWKYPIGSEIQFAVANEQFKFGKQVKLMAKNIQKPKEFLKANTRSINTNDSILLQVCYKENMQAFGKENEAIVIPTSIRHFNELKEFLNSL